MAFGQGHFVEVPGFGRPRGRPFGGHVPPGVFGQVVAAHEAAVAHVAHKLFLASVCPAVAGKLVGAGKLFIAAFPVTAEWLFTCGGRREDTNTRCSGFCITIKDAPSFGIQLFN